MGKTLKVFVNGSFDVLHSGHLELLNYAKSLGNHLLVAIDSDERIKEKKGSTRPFNSQIERYSLMKNLKPVDDVKVFGSDEELVNIVKEYAPDIMIIGSDWKGKTVIGQQYANTLIYFERVNDVSTTQKLESYFNRRLMH